VFELRKTAWPELSPWCLFKIVMQVVYGLYITTVPPVLNLTGCVEFGKTAGGGVKLPIPGKH